MRTHGVGSRKTTTGRRGIAAAVLGCLVTSLGAPAPLTAAPQKKNPRPRRVFEVRSTYTRDFGLAAPAGIAYDPAQKALLVAGAAGDGTRLIRLATSEDYLGTVDLPDGDARTLAFDATRGRVALLDGRDVVTASPRGPSRSRPQTQRTNLRSVPLGRPAGAAFDASGDLLVLDASDRSVVRITGGDPVPRVSRVRLTGVDDGVRALAFNPSDGLLYVMSPAARRLYAVDGRGRLRRTYSLRSVPLRDPLAITFAPSADTTDDARNTNLFVADGKGTTASGAVTEIKLTRTVSTAAEAVPTVTASLVQVIDTSKWSPASPDPAGIVHLPGSDRLAIADSEVDEITGAGYHGVNLWQSTRGGAVLDTGTTRGYTSEPTGLGFDQASNTLFISSDDNRRVFLVRPGADTRFGTSDDAISSIDVGGKYGVMDAEDPEFDPASGHLFFLDGVGTEVYRIDPVNGVFGDADDVMTHFDVGQFGATDVEGLGSDASAGTLLVGDRGQRKIYEVTKAGQIVRIIDARVTGMRYISGLAMAPASSRAGVMNYWVVDRGVDNGPDPNENDGKVFEVTLSSTNSAPVIASVTINPATPRTNDTLTATVSASDPDGDPLTYTYQWNRNGVAIPGATASTFDLSVSGNGGKGDAISVRVTASDGQALDTETSSQVTVLNSAPAFNQDLDDRSSAEGESVSLSAAASDADGDLLTYGASGLPPGVSINTSSGLISGTIELGAASGSPYAVAVTVREGATVDATDTFTWTVTQRTENAAPVVNSVTVAPASPTTNDTVRAVVDASDPDGDALTYTYQWLKNGSELGGETRETLDLSAAGNGGPGDQIAVRVVASDGQATSDAATSAAVTIVDAPPTASITAPADGSSLSGTVTLRADAADDVDVIQVSFFDGTSLIATDTDGSDGWSVPWNTVGAVDGPHVIGATATDSAGQTGRDSIGVTVDNTAPSVAITSPAPGATVSFTVAVGASASDNSLVSSVEFFVDGASIGSDTDGSNGWAVSWNTTTTSNGSHSLTARARDRAGNATTSDAVAVTVDNQRTVSSDIPIATGSDDVEERSSGRVWLNNGDLEMVMDGSDRQTVGVRFVSVNIPRGARITNAYVQFQTDHTDSVATDLTIRGHAADSAPAFTTTRYNVSNRTRTTASVSWSPPPWTRRFVAEIDQRTPDLTPVLQEIVDRAGWASGNAVALIVTGSGTRSAQSFDGGYASILHVEYTAR